MAELQDKAQEEKGKPELFELRDVPIFDTGKWNGDKYEERDLDEMVESFHEIGSKIKPYVKLGHDSGQKLLQKDGFPAAAWITGIRRKGKQLFADFSNMPKKIYELVARKAYGRVSSEIYWNLKEGGKTYRRVLKGVALLGADTPALTSLDDFINLYTETEMQFENLKSYDNMETDMEKEHIEQIENELKKYKIENEKLEKENQELKSYSERVEYEKKHAEADAYIEKAIEEGRITPAQKDYFLAIAMDSSVKSYSKDNKIFSGDGFYYVKGIIGNMATVQMGEQAHVKEQEKKSYSKNNSDDLDKKIKEYAEKHSVNYAVAYEAVVNEEV